MSSTSIAGGCGVDKTPDHEKEEKQEVEVHLRKQRHSLLEAMAFYKP